MEDFLLLLRINITRVGLWSKVICNFRPFLVANRFYRPHELDNLVNDDHSIVNSPPQFSYVPEDASIQHSSEQCSPSPLEPALSGQIEIDSAEEAEPLLPPTLETRKKKKKSSSMITPGNDPAPIDRQPSPPLDLTLQATSVSTKRKYVPEDDDRFVSNLAVDDDEFQFTRPIPTPTKQTNAFDITQRNQSPIKNHVEMAKGSKPRVLSMRKVLEPSRFPRPSIVYLHSMKR